jgi:hypothetical protein
MVSRFDLNLNPSFKALFLNSKSHCLNFKTLVLNSLFLKRFKLQVKFENLPGLKV